MVRHRLRELVSQCASILRPAETLWRTRWAPSASEETVAVARPSPQPMTASARTESAEMRSVANLTSR
ncbi:MAG: hypothetical protein QOE89_2289 [Pseudonocardiales bacterium]|nr:hypothetical protein [Pseudonocardiales bacterium]